jgi:hypothetical protein
MPKPREVDRTGPITLLTARSAGLQVLDMPDIHTSLENDTLDQASGDSDTV